MVAKEPAHLFLATLSIMRTFTLAEHLILVIGLSSIVDTQQIRSQYPVVDGEFVWYGGDDNNLNYLSYFTSIDTPSPLNWPSRRDYFMSTFAPSENCMYIMCGLGVGLSNNPLGAISSITDSF